MSGSQSRSTTVAITRVLYSNISRQNRQCSSAFVSSAHGNVRCSSRGQSCRRRCCWDRPVGQSTQSRTVGNVWIVLFRPRRGTLVVGNVRQSAFLAVREACPVFQVHRDCGDVGERALSGLVRAGDFDTVAGSERACCYTRNGSHGRRASCGGGL